MDQAGRVDVRGISLCVYNFNSFRGKLSTLSKVLDQREIMYAFVRFFEDDMCYALPVSSVKDFRPRHKTDFDHQKVYLVVRGEENGTGQPSKAQVLALAGKLPDRMEAFLLDYLFHFFNTPTTTTTTSSLLTCVH